ncbi:MAG: hypothetical protein ACI867_001837, partial [Glaciecola sp.]
MPLLGDEHPIFWTTMTAAGLDEHEPFGGRDRSTLRRFAEVRGVIGGNRMPHETVRLFAQ